MAASLAIPVEARYIHDVLRVLHARIQHRMRLIVEGSIRICLALVYSKHFLVMDENLIRKTLDNPFVHESIKRCDSLLRVPFETFIDKVVEGVTLAHQNLIEWLRGGYSEVSLRVSRKVWFVGLLIKEDALSASL